MRVLSPVAFAALLLVQVFPSVALAWRHAALLANGRPVLLAVQTRDPRDLFRGEYSQLGYEIGQLRLVPVAPEAAAPPCDFGARDTCGLGAARTIYVALAPDERGVHRATAISLEKPSPGQLFVAGTLRYGQLRRRGAVDGPATCAEAACLSGSVSYGIETWYGEQGRPARLDRVARKDVLVEARIDEDGLAALDGILVGGESFAKTARLWR